MAWRDIADSEVDPESPVTTSLAQAWRDNPIGIANGDSGAPRIVQGAIDSGAVGQGELVTSEGSISITAPSGGDAGANKLLPGGSYGLYPRIEVDGPGTGSGELAQDLSDNGSPENIVWIYASGDTTTYYYQRYIQASPPYDLGDGDIPMFVFAEVLRDGSVAGLYVAEDPPWANNGPTDIRPHRVDSVTGKKYRKEKRPHLTSSDYINGRCGFADYIAAIRDAKEEEFEVTKEYKNADMHLHPHSWVTPPSGTIVMLDPPETQDILDLYREGGDIMALIRDGHIKIGDEINRNAPPGVVPVSWRVR